MPSCHGLNGLSEQSGIHFNNMQYWKTILGVLLSNNVELFVAHWMHRSQDYWQKWCLNILLKLYGSSEQMCNYNIHLRIRFDKRLDGSTWCVYPNRTRWMWFSWSIYWFVYDSLSSWYYVKLQVKLMLSWQLWSPSFFVVCGRVGLYIFITWFHFMCWIPLLSCVCVCVCVDCHVKCLKYMELSCENLHLKKLRQLKRLFFWL